MKFPRIQSVLTAIAAIALLHHHVHPIASRQPPRLNHRGIGKIECGDPVPAAGQEPRIMTSPSARNRNASPSRTKSPRSQPVFQSRRGPAEVPAVLAARVEAVPVAGRAHGWAMRLHSSP